jgi:hypothetical protein
MSSGCEMPIRGRHAPSPRVVIPAAKPVRHLAATRDPACFWYCHEQKEEGEPRTSGQIMPIDYGLQQAL